MSTDIATVTITYFDTAMALIEIGSLRLLTDPVLDPAGTVFTYGPIRLEKTGAASVTAEALGRIDAVLLSHDQHGDNLDHAGRSFLAGVGRVITTPLAASRLGLSQATGLEPWAETTLFGADGSRVVVTAAPAQHGPDGTQDATGPVTGFLLSWDGHANAVYVSGDTVPFAGTAEIARRAAPVGVALLNIGQVRLDAVGETDLSMSAADALAYAAALGAGHVLPLHFEGWRHFSEDAKSARAIMARGEIAPRVTWLEPAKPVVFEV